MFLQEKRLIYPYLICTFPSGIRVEIMFLVWSTEDCDALKEMSKFNFGVRRNVTP